MVRNIYSERYSAEDLACPEGEGMTQQQFKEECDINTIMRKFEKTGILPEMIKAEPRYGDYSNPMDYQEAQNLVLHAQSQFEALSAKVRERFGNDPQRFLAWATDASNLKEMADLGLLNQEALDRVKAAQESENTPAPKLAAAAKRSAAVSKKGSPEEGSDQSIT